MAQNLQVKSSSEIITWPIEVSPSTPRIFLGTTPIVPVDDPASPTGYQVAFIDTSTKPATISTQYISLEKTANWMNGALDTMYDDLQTALETAPDNGWVVVASFGLDGMMCPSQAVLDLLNSLGAGSQLSTWMSDTGPGNCGSQADNNQWVSWPTTYILIGAPGAGSGNGTEAFQWNKAGTIGTNRLIG